MGRPAVFDEEFKSRAVALVRASSRPRYLIAKDLGVSDTSLGKWVKERAGGDSVLSGAVSDRKEIARLKRELAEVAEERDILKKAVALFAKGPRG